MLSPAHSQLTHSQLIDAPCGKLEVDALWQADSTGVANPNAAAVERVAILCHPNPLQEGTMMNKVVTTMYRFARDQNMHVVRFNFRGVGQSTGEYGNVTGEIEDALTVLQWIHSQTEARKLWIGGFSFGGFVAAKLAQRVNEQGAFLGVDDFDITDLALIAPSIEKNDTSDLLLPTAQTFMIYGANDEVIAPSSLQQFGENFGIQTHIIDDTGHFFHGKLGELKQLLEALSSK
ncbi:alpha/beta hydrolase [Moraxella osloensis]|uniref:Alpha/beta hydrolase n=1 Tax=Faucicola osloensis TaxID=34062 RepID=A0A2I1RIP3_FAUOS|nr:alpha/beta fold hydrolase [Moraxella osloensis]PKZ68992.1 alpha/beta hydrolase [Moraxella osloensis]